MSTVLSNEIWFVLGMCICVFNVQLKGRKAQGTICGLVFMTLSVVVYMMELNNKMVSFILGLLACIAVIFLVADFEERFGRCMNFLAKYTMPIFLMHTLFAAPLRAVLLKLGFPNAVLHVMLGIVVSFAGPIIAAEVMKRSRWLEFFLYPRKFIK